jgi:hypothetical protein
VIDLAALASCSELTSEHAKQAASSSAEIRTLLARVSQIAKPGEGCPKVLMAVARLVGQPWVEGDLRIELSGDDTSTSLSINCDFGVGIRERLVPAVRFAVPLDEFERALELAPKLVLPLRIADEKGMLVLTPLLSPESRAEASLPDVAVDSASLGDGERITAPPPADELLVIDEATPAELAALGHGTSPDSPDSPDELDSGWGLDEVTTAPPPPGHDASAQLDDVHAGRMESGPVPSGPPAEGAEAEPAPRSSNIHTRPTVRQMVAVDVAALGAAQRRDPRREEE